jgi:tetrahydromethanopterin S-methyltransferase subunit C
MPEKKRAMHEDYLLKRIAVTDRGADRVRIVADFGTGVGVDSALLGDWSREAST